MPLGHFPLWLSLYALRETVADLHHLVNMRQHTKPEETIDKEQLTHLLYHYHIHGEEKKRLIGTSLQEHQVSSNFLVFSCCFGGFLMKPGGTLPNNLLLLLLL
jgi:hypothetical protein